MCDDFVTSQTYFYLSIIIPSPERKVTRNMGVWWQTEKARGPWMPESNRQRACASEREGKRNECLKVRVSSECVWRSAWAKNVSVTAALCICLAWVTPVTQTFPSSLLEYWTTAALPGANLHTSPHMLFLCLSLCRPGNRLCVSPSRPGLTEPYDPARTSQTVPLLSRYSAGQGC